MKSIKKSRSGRLTVIGLVMGLIVGGTLAFGGVTFAGTSPPTTISTCVKANHHGVYGKPKITTGTSCPTGQHYQAWVLPSPPPAPPTCGFGITGIPVQAGVVFGANGDVWGVVVPASQYSSSCHPAGNLSATGTFALSSTALQDSGASSGVVVSTGASVTNGADFWGWTWIQGKEIFIV